MRKESQMNRIMDALTATWLRFKNRGNPNYKFTWGPEAPWSDDGQSAKRY